ncbi:hypothetical protein LJY25_13090 [Hymenobacter sp. BT175]|uniref:hypothetical protein n=1 Tax=Hymenobacter translucens TaxID=2886507 RepID=UPI001D0E67D1|nr:hypothetical protein [Hymenobacter translucens]MCC2547384.1 hypothetical protein [Hymenobacter translucens]
MQETTTPKWIQELQESSWELELLISGGAIFSLIQASGFFIDAVQSLKITTWLPGMDLFLLLGVLGIQVLTLSFGLHLVLRAVWVALVCVTYLYPGGAAPERVRWRRPFRSAAPSGSYLHLLIVRFNRVCATVMFLAIISTLLLGGLMLIVGVTLMLPGLFISIRPPGWYYLYTDVLVGILVLYLLDLVGFGALRRVPVLAEVLFPVFWLFDRISLRVVIQPALWLFASHVPRLRMAGLLAAFMAVALLYSYAVLYQSLHLPNAFDRRTYRRQMAPGPLMLHGTYRDELNGEPLRGASIPSKLIDKPFLELFMVYRKEFDRDLLERPDTDYLSELVVVSIDDSVYQRVDWYPTRKQTNDQLGITAMLPIGKLRVGPHRLLITSRVDSTRRQTIPFWKTE